MINALAEWDATQILTEFPNVIISEWRSTFTVILCGDLLHPRWPSWQIRGFQWDAIICEHLGVCERLCGESIEEPMKESKNLKESLGKHQERLGDHLLKSPKEDIKEKRSGWLKLTNCNPNASVRRRASQCFKFQLKRPASLYHLGGLH